MIGKGIVHRRDGMNNMPGTDPVLAGINIALLEQDHASKNVSNCQAFEPTSIGVIS